LGYSVEFLPHALRDFKALDRSVQKRIAKAIDGLEMDPRPHGSQKMAGLEGTYRIRVGDYRIIYQVKDEKLLVILLKVGHRGEIYR
jgi:mRNA interferase RelE/StbE